MSPVGPHSIEEFNKCHAKVDEQKEKQISCVGVS